jgi:exportin-7
MLPIITYKYRYRGIYLCQLILSRGLQGGYCNFGVFVVYQDPTLTDAIDVVFKLSLSIPIPEILVTPMGTKK